jgi:hypothetical protein
MGCSVSHAAAGASPSPGDSPPACICFPALQDTKPIFIRENYKGADKLKGKVAIITGVCQGSRSTSVVSWPAKNAAALQGRIAPTHRLLPTVCRWRLWHWACCCRAFRP